MIDPNHTRLRRLWIAHETDGDFVVCPECSAEWDDDGQPDWAQEWEDFGEVYDDEPNYICAYWSRSIRIASPQTQLSGAARSTTSFLIRRVLLN